MEYLRVESIATDNTYLIRGEIPTPMLLETALNCRFLRTVPKLPFLYPLEIESFSTWQYPTLS